MDWRAFVPMLLAYLVSLSWHESAHAWTAWRLGDSTGRALGRISLNPVRHIDPFGTVLLPLLLWFGSGGRVMFGYAKPVPYNPYALRNPALGSAMVAGAGPLSNLLLAGVAAVSLGLLFRSGATGFGLGLATLDALLVVNVYLAVFNLIPLPPLDGGTVLAGLLPRPLADAYERNRMLAFVLFVVLMASGALSPIIVRVSNSIIEPLATFARGTTP